jgi:hypothetical protein
MHAKALQKPKSETKSRRIDAAVKQEHKDMSLRKAAQIFDVAHTSISRRQLGRCTEDINLDRSERLATKEFKDECLRLAKIHKSYYK